MRAVRLAAAAVLLVLGPVPAHGAPSRVVAAVAEVYVPGDQEIPRGESLTLVNLERSPHDVTAVDAGPDGWPLFKSATLYEPGVAPVVGVESLEPGIYQFYCSVHEQMRGTVTVA